MSFIKGILPNAPQKHEEFYMQGITKAYIFTDFPFLSTMCSVARNARLCHLLSGVKGTWKKRENVGQMTLTYLQSTIAAA